MNRHLTAVMVAVLAAVATLFTAPASADHRPGNVVVMGGTLALTGRLGARRLLAPAVEIEVTVFVDGHADPADKAGRRRIVRHGYLPEREIQSVRFRCIPVPIRSHPYTEQILDRFSRGNVKSLIRRAY